MAKSSRPHVLVVGSSNTDLVVVSSRLPRPGETLLGGEFRCVAGGKGANQAVAAARAGAAVFFIGACGDDDFGRRARTALKKEGIGLRHFQMRKGISSGVALILVGGPARENMISVARSANDSLALEDLRAARAEFKKAGVVVSQLEIPTGIVEASAAMAREAGVPFLLNPAPARRLSRRLVADVHILTPNEHEARILTGESDLEKAGRRLLHLGCRHVVITPWPEGCPVGHGWRRSPLSRAESYGGGHRRRRRLLHRVARRGRGGRTGPRHFDPASASGRLLFRHAAGRAKFHALPPGSRARGTDLKARAFPATNLLVAG
jgi:ribokinase